MPMPSQPRGGSDHYQEGSSMWNKSDSHYEVDDLDDLLRSEFGRLVERLEDGHYTVHFPSDHPYTVGIVHTPDVEVGDQTWPGRTSVFCAVGEGIRWEDAGVATFLVREMSELPLGRLICVDDTVLVEHSLFGDILAADEIRLAVEVVAGAAERTGRVLRSSLIASAA
jgi:hypothetical protein